mgnify:CR=1 FL=1
MNEERPDPLRFPAWLQEFAAAYDTRGNPISGRTIELDADPETVHWAFVLHEDVRRPGTDAAERRAAYGAVISLAGGQYAVHGFEFPEESYGEAFIAAWGDLTGDGAGDIVWGSVSVGAHTAWASYTVSTWSGGELQAVRGTAEMPNAGGAAVTEDGKLRITGGLIGSAGAGPWQREYTDEYVVADHALVWTDRAFSASPTSYHRLLDALWAEELGQTEKAKRLFSEAAGMEDESYAGYSFETADGIAEGGTDPDLERRFGEAVRAFSRFRLALLEERAKGASADAACAAAKRAAGFDPGWLPLLNAPFGYANPKWDEASACAPIGGLA